MRLSSPRPVPGRTRRALLPAALAAAALAALAGSAQAAPAPKVTLVAPAKSSTVVAGKVVLRARSASPRGIRRVEFRIDGRRRWVQSRAPWRFGGRRGAWNTRSVRPGVRRITVLAVDRAGRKRAVTRRVKVVRARTRPYVAFTRPRARARVSGGVRWDVQAAADRGVRRVEFRVDGKRRWTQRRAPWRFGGRNGLWNTTRYPTGSRRLAVTVVDRAGRRRTIRRTVVVARGPGGGPAAPAPAPALPAAPPVATYNPPTPPAAPLPAATRFIAPGGSDSGSCTAAAPCRSMGRAYAVARPGEVVEMAGGSYPHQALGSGSGRPASPPVYFRPAPGAQVGMSNLRFDGTAGAEVRDVATVGWYVGEGSTGIALRGVRSTGGNFINSSTHVTVVGGEIGPIDSADGVQIKRTSGGVNPSDLIFDGIRMHDLTRRADPAHHTDCMQFGAGERVVIRNSSFDNCSTQGVFTREFSGGIIRDWTIENNVFGKANEGYYSLIIHRELSADKKFTVRYNSSIQGWRLESHGLTVVGNVAPMSSNACDSAITYRHNVWSNARCHSTDVTASPGFVNAGALDLRLAPGSAAIDRGDPANYPATDMFGTGRPRGGRPDAGAHERQ